MNIQNRKPTNLSLDSNLVEEARGLQIYHSLAVEDGVRVDVFEARARLWKAENAAAIASSIAFVDENGLPLEEYRLF